LTYGVSAARHAEAQVKRLLVKAARTRIALADHSKFGLQSFAYVGPISDISILVTDSGTDPASIRGVEEAGVQVRVATEHGNEKKSLHLAKVATRAPAARTGRVPGDHVP
jgi:DeoR/GlpR family transcriptional regulator of sugar metabolism